MQTLTELQCGRLDDAKSESDDEHIARRKNDRILREFFMYDPDQAIEWAPTPGVKDMKCSMA